MEDVYYTCMTKEPVELVQGIENHRIVKIIEALLWGITVNINEFKLRLAPAIGGGYTPVIILNEEEKIISGFEDVTFNWLTRYSEMMSDEDYKKMLFDLASSKAIPLSFSGL